jgi:hypothetical protein
MPRIRVALLHSRVTRFTHCPFRAVLPEHERGSGAALKKAIEGVLSDIELDLQSEVAERTRARV